QQGCKQGESAGRAGHIQCALGHLLQRVHRATTSPTCGALERRCAPVGAVHIRTKVAKRGTMGIRYRESVPMFVVARPTATPKHTANTRQNIMSGDEVSAVHIARGPRTN